MHIDDMIHEAWLRDADTDESYWLADGFDAPADVDYDGEYRDPWTGELIDHLNDTYTVFVLAEWTNVLDIRHDVPLDGVPYYADRAKFLAWDHPGGPITCQVYAIPSARMPDRPDRITTTMMRYARYVDGYDAKLDGAPTPLDAPQTSDLQHSINQTIDGVPWDDPVVGALGTGPGVAP